MKYQIYLKVIILIYIVSAGGIIYSTLANHKGILFISGAILIFNMGQSFVMNFLKLEPNEL